MTTLALAAPVPRPDSLADIGRAGVFLAVVASGVVRWEPAPVDLVLLVLIVAMPLAGLVALTRGLVLMGALCLACGAGALVAAGFSGNPGKALLHTGISLYLYAAFVVLAGFVAQRPAEHARLILDAWVAAAAIAAAAAFAGYFALVPGAAEAFTKFGRAAGTFKDPNVLGAFLVPAVVWLVHRALAGPVRSGLIPLAGAGCIALAVLVSFSRGAWINLAVALAVYGYLAWVTAPTEAARSRILTLGALALIVLAALLAVASRSPAVADLLSERSSLAQGYDVGPQGRFGGQEKAMALVLASPFGIGAYEFNRTYHHEDVHNVYVSMFLNAGWLGGTLYLFIIGATIVAGALHVLRDSAARPMFVVAFAAFLGNVVEGVVIDTDHWRHFYLLLAVVWGLIAAEDRQRSGSVAGSTP